MNVTNKPDTTQRFIVLDRSHELIRALRALHAKIRTADADLAGQIRRAASSIALNLGEGRRRSGRDRLRFYRYAAGSADETRVALKVAAGWGYIREQEAAECDDILDHILAMLHKITR